MPKTIISNPGRSELPDKNAQQARKEKAVSRYAKAGFALTPLKGKVPTKPNWPDTMPDDTMTLRKLGCGNFGVVLQAHDLVIDVDPRNFKHGINSLEQLMIDLEIKGFDTLIVRTGGGGVHIYLKKPPEISICTKLPGYPGIEFKSKGSQVVGAGSIHPETRKAYTFVQPPLNVEDLDWLVRK